MSFSTSENGSLAALLYKARAWVMQRPPQIKAVFPPSLRLWFGWYLLALGVGISFLHHYLHNSALQLQKTLTPAFQTPDIEPNMFLVQFLILVAAVCGCMVLHWLHESSPPLLKTLPFRPKILFLLSLCAISLMHLLLSGLLIFSAIFLSCSCIPGSGPLFKKYLQQISRSVVWIVTIIPCPVIWVGASLPIITAVTILVMSWYPIVIPNDYYELPDRLHTGALFTGVSSNAPVTLSRETAIDCLENALKTADSPKSEPLPCPLGPEYKIDHFAAQILEKTGFWQVQAGRLMFHHSYLFVPARHIERYGLSGNVPMLYGIANTTLFAVAMKLFGDTLGDYFNMYFASLLLGFLCIGLTVYFVTRNRTAFLASLALGMSYFYGIGYTATFISGGFTPMRFLGLMLQTGSILYLFRTNTNRGVIVLWLAFAGSLLWNREFAMLGLIGQVMALSSPCLKLPLARRIASMIVLIALLPLLLLLTGATDPNLLYSNQFGLFGLGLPSIRSHLFYALIQWFFPCIALAAYGATRFPPAACHARLCILSILALLMTKYLFNASPEHLCSVLSFIAPMSLLYYPGWTRPIRPVSSQTLIYLASMTYLLVTGVNYHKEAVHYRKTYITPFVTRQWNGVHDTLRSAAPDAALARRVDTIAKVMAPDDRILFLSPYDHLLSFYTAPRYYCGHFELLTNLVTTDQVSHVTECALRNPKTLVVYDKALNTPACSKSDAKAGFIDWPSCIAKWKLKQTLVSIRDQLAPHLRTVGETEELILYRSE